MVSLLCSSHRQIDIENQLFYSNQSALWRKPTIRKILKQKPQIPGLDRPTDACCILPRTEHYFNGVEEKEPDFAILPQRAKLLQTQKSVDIWDYKKNMLRKITFLKKVIYIERYGYKDVNKQEKMLFYDNALSRFFFLILYFLSLQT